MDYKSFVPSVVYEGKDSKNILSKVVLIRNLIKQYKVFYNYTVKDGERPDMIAYDYYGDSSYEWLVCLPNNVMDIQSQWPKSYTDFYKYMEDTYGSINATQNTIHHYKYTGIGGNFDNPRKTWKMTQKTYDYISSEEKSGWSPVYLFDYELELNEKLRNIVLLSNTYLDQIDREIKDLFK